ncbi:MAG: SCP2 sterol-binding domain-containing protein [Bacteroidetes bacterium]|nr:SCP2 sterol-binding domain-containing protein [Rhodothermia bacterium]MCS7154913.1 SCP2 sterol-binding domain-containing protein [Bacteroidota bacterium]MCX7906928.1 SCP2 sterol-binding domain-containing protein [Bacteroidota bacterium]MDW8137708.1 SCP2 sterol-binding domain-containing protein [Bacteroidota bacterium]MDW8285338.1 SCP2 sterol-binding domain-containing protein [Bacteroidota bacterium]
MGDELFTQERLQRWCQALNASSEYREAARDWEGALALIAIQDGVERVAYLDLHRGTCRGARLASPQEAEAAAYVLVGDRQVWEQVLFSGLDPVLALMSGKLRLRKGNPLSLSRYMAAARLLAEVARWSLSSSG